MLTRIAQWWTRPSSEADAMRRVLEGGVLARASMAWRAGLALALDPDDTQQVFYLAIAVDQLTLQRLAAHFASDPEGRELLRTKPAIDSRHVDLAALRALPEDTLGGAYARMLTAKGLDADFFQRPPGLPEDIAYVAQRLRQTHDLWHVMTGLDTDIPGEIALQAFTHAQIGQNFSRLIVTFGQIFYSPRYPHVWGMVRRARRAGREAAPLATVHWETLWAEPLAAVRERLRVPRLG